MPLYMYDDSSLETLKSSKEIIEDGTVEGEDGASLEGAGLYVNENPEGEEGYEGSIGTFKRALVTGWDEKEECFEGMWYESAEQGRWKRCEVCFDGEDR